MPEYPFKVGDIVGAFLPLYIDFTGRRVVIFGGGSVGERKARFFSQARVTVVSPTFTEGLEAMGRDELVTLERKPIGPGDVKAMLEGAFIIVAATGDPALNESISQTARESGVLANSASGDSPVILPSVIRKSDIAIAISTGGHSPAMAKYLRKKLEASLGEDMDRMVMLQEHVRESLKSAVKSQKRREEILWEILDDPEVWDALKESYDRAFELARRHMAE